jgi:hypothetical protein
MQWIRLGQRALRPNETDGVGMKTLWSGIAISVFALVGAASATLRVPQPPAAGATLSEDRGKLLITVDGQTVATEDFQITRDGDNWVAHGTTDIHAGKEIAHVTGELRLNSAGEPLRYVWSTVGDKKATSTTVFEGTIAKITLNMGDGKPIEQDFHFASPVVILDNNLYHQYEILARVYNWTAGGAQTFAVLIPQEQSPGNITVESLGNVNLEGAKYTQLVVRTEDLQVNIYLDSSHRLMRLIVPASKAEIRRQ